MILEKIKYFLKWFNPKVIIVIFIILYSVSPIVYRATSTYLTTYFYMIITVLTVVYTFIACKLRNIKEYIFFLIPFVIFEILQMLISKEDDVLLLGYQILLFMLPVCLGYYLINNSKKQNIYTPVFLVVTGITVITTIIGCIANPNAARTLATTATSQDPIAVLYDWQNIGGYTFVYQTVLLYPVAVMAFKLKRIHIVVFVAITVMLFAMVINAEYTLALICMLFSSLMLFVNKKTTKRKLMMILIFGALGVIVFPNVVIAIVTYIGDAIGNPEMAEKLTAAFSGGDALNSLEDNRLERYLQSLGTFIQHPLFGKAIEGSGKIGGHSTIFDTLGNFGLLGGTLLFFMYRGIYKTFLKPFSGDYGFIYLFWMFLETIALSCLNTGLWYNNLCVFAPIMVCTIYGRYEPRKRIPKPDFVKSPVKSVNEPTTLKKEED